METAAFVMWLAWLLQDFMKAAQCFMYEFTDLGWRPLDAAGSTSGPREDGFVWHTDPGCVLLPEDTRICFIRCDEFTCVQKEVSRPGRPPLPGPSFPCGFWLCRCCEYRTCRLAHARSLCACPLSVQSYA